MQACVIATCSTACRNCILHHFNPALKYETRRVMAEMRSVWHACTWAIHLGLPG